MCLLVLPKSPNSSKNKQRPGYAAIRGATLNVHSMRDGYKLADLAINCRKFRQDFLMVQETWRNGPEDLKIQHKSLKNWRFIGSGFGKGCRGGVGVILSPSCTVLDSRAILDGRILRVDINLRGQHLAIFSVYSPDETYSEDTKLSFWNILGKGLDSVGGNLKRFVGGDMNATIVEPDRACMDGVNHEFCHERATETSART